MDADLLIRGATVYPGEGLPRIADVAVRGGTIAAVAASLATDGALEVIDAPGLLLCPGFVDMHAHTALRSHDEPLLGPKLLQGFTTELIGPDGLAPAPVARERIEERRAYLRGLEGSGPPEWAWSTFAEYLDWLASTRPATTLVPSIGHNAVRELVLGSERRAATARELEAMRAEVRLGLEAGARTLSFGLIYLPGAYADTDELVALAEVAAEYGAPLVPHVRNEGLGLLAALSEMCEVARRSGAPLHVSHLKSRSDPALIEPMLELLERESTRISLSFDQYPYGAGSTVLSALLPPWAQEGGASATLTRLADPAERRRMAADMEVETDDWEGILASLGPEQVVIANAASPNEAAVGRSLAAIAEERGVDAATASFDLLAESALDVTMISHYASDQDVRRIAAHPLQLVGSDGIFGARPHPRLYATAARFLGRFALRDGLIPVEEAVARLTARAAARIGLDDRGRIAPGLRADLVLLDPALYVDEATYDDPCRSPQGVAGVWVAGEAVVRDGRVTGARPGGVVREPLPRR